MSFLFKRKQLVLSGLIVALGAAMFVNWYYTKPPVSGTSIESEGITTQIENQNLGTAQQVNGSNVSNSDYFTTATLKRQKSHDEMKETYLKLLENKEISAEEKNIARKNYDNLCENIKMETDTENLINAKIGKKVLVISGDTIEVITEKNTLNDSVIMQIKEIIVNKSKISAEKITIVEVK
ncbi:MAG: SpoIIIAH-like family protein [Oscillospiraceae bacterium]